jgi:tellurium resistance protein TerD
VAISLAKGANLSLTKAAPGLAAVTVGLGWDARTTIGDAFDLDASAICAGADGKALSDGHFVFYGQPASADGSVKHSGDNKTGEGGGDDEQLTVDLAAVPEACTRIIFSASIYEGQERGQNFGQVREAFIRVVNQAGGEELARFDLSEDSSTEIAMIFGELYRNSGEWKFKAVGQGYATGLKGIAQEFGVNV